uniref:Sodium/potassium-transporting ATPase subunit alpha n=1 Tax=Parastrongyloides trichosuri TaxID=131310 RepID=A0A0N4ZA40_PARTI
MNIFKKKKQNENKINLEELKKDVTIDYHKIPLKEFEQKFETDSHNGLTSAKAAELLKKYGKNELTPPPQPSKLWTFFKILVGGFNALLWTGSFACFTSYIIESNTFETVRPDNLYIGGVIAVVTLLTSSYQFYQGQKASNIMESFKKMVPHKAIVIRDGKKHEIDASEVVPGDLLEVVGGDRLAGDIRIVKSMGLRVDNSSLTGECEPQGRTAEFTNNNPLESKNVALFSTNVVEGVGKGLVMLTGDKTIMGRIASLSSQVTSGKTPMTQDLHNFLKIISYVALSKGIIFFILLMWFNRNLLEAFIFMIAIVVATVPEGIMVSVTICLTLTAKEMAKKNCLVKKLDAVETLGSTSTICSDKTGTLTQNRMTVSHLYDNIKILNTAPTDPLLKGITSTNLFRVAALCSRAYFKEDQEKEPILDRKTIGDASEAAILKWCEINGENVENYRSLYPKVVEIPFNSVNKYQVSIHKKHDGTFLLVMKGAPEKIFGLCKTIIVDGKEQEITKAHKDRFQSSYESLGSLGERVLGFCDLELDTEKYPVGFMFDLDKINFPLSDLRFCGLISMIDPPRPGVPEAVLLCKDAGIRVTMVTGDHFITARAIASQCNIIDSIHECRMLVTNEDYDSFDFNNLEKKADSEPDIVQKSQSLRTIEEKPRAIVIHGEQLRKLENSQLDTLCKYYNQVIFSRTSPAQKLQIVESYQRLGNVVAVTGDGVNDAPALKKADIGIAMGIAGTDVSKQAADMILMNDNFASIITGVKEGRRIFDNLKKTIAYTLTSKIPETTPFVMHCICGIPLPLSVIGIFAIDLGTDLWPAISLAYEEAESDIMLRPPRNLKYNKLVNFVLIRFAYLQIGMIQGLAGFITYFIIMADNGWWPAQLLGLRSVWNDPNENSLVDSYGQEWTYDSRRQLEGCCHGAFFYAIVVVQWADLLISRTRTNSMLTHGIDNQVLNSGLFFTVLLTVFLLYTPGVNTVFAFNGITLKWAFVAVPFAWVIYMYDETRKYLIRKHPTGFLYKETYY